MVPDVTRILLDLFIVVTDITGSQLYKKGTGGLECKRGTDKNSQKTIEVLIKKAIAECELMSVTKLYCSVNAARFNRAHKGTTKYALKLLQTLKTKIQIANGIANDTPISISTIRVAGGRRGRRV